MFDIDPLNLILVMQAKGKYLSMLLEIFSFLHSPPEVVPGKGEFFLCKRKE